jgi:hypothetical protein
MWQVFKSKTRKESCAEKVGSYMENALKPQYLARNKPRARTLFMANIIHQVNKMR